MSTSGLISSRSKCVSTRNTNLGRHGVGGVKGERGASVQSQAGKQGLPPGLTPALTLGNLGKEGERAEHKGHTLPSPG